MTMGLADFVVGLVVGSWWRSKFNDVNLASLSDDEFAALQTAVFRDTLFVLLCKMNIDEYGCYDDSFFKHFFDSKDKLAEFANEIVYGNEIDEFVALDRFKEIVIDEEPKMELLKHLKDLAPKPLTDNAKDVLEIVEFELK